MCNICHLVKLDAPPYGSLLRDPLINGTPVVPPGPRLYSIGNEKPPFWGCHLGCPGTPPPQGPLGRLLSDSRQAHMEPPDHMSIGADRC